MQFLCVSNWIGIPIFSDISSHALIIGIMPSTDKGVTWPMTSTNGDPKSFAIFKVSSKEETVLGKATIKGIRSFFSR